jgi:lipopolysaccharide/colanic/teichoic acid biosynthesis glycosyltransferase
MIKSTVFVLFMTNMIIVFFNISDFSRFQFFGSFIGLLIIESIITLVIVRHSKQIKILVYQVKPKTQHVSWILMAYDYILLIASILISIIIKYKRIYVNLYGFEMIIVLSCLWYINSCYTGKFKKGKSKNFAYAFSPYLFTYFITISEIAILVYAFRKFGASKELLYLPNTLLLAFELPLSYLYFLKKSFPMNEPDIESLEQARSFIDIDAANEKADVKPVQNPARESLNARFRKDNAALFEFIDKNILLNEIDESKTTVFKSYNPYNMNMLNDHSQKLFINLQRINDIRRINKYFLQVYNKTARHGYIVGVKHTIQSYHELFFKKYPFVLANFLYALDFVITRICPKIPGVKAVYFAICKGKNRTVSKAELLGRLSFCGFKIIQTEIINNKLYFIAQKTKLPSMDLKPSYGPLVQLKRIGYQGKTIFIKKLRTMHPYSEYIQDYVHEIYQLQENGKFKDDFRVTEWGKFLRKIWVDELPQISNFLKGDLKLVGVRALSKHYFSLYPPDLRELRIKFKPGLVPPYYADMPKNFDEIVNSERRYLLRKAEKPFSTDVIYLFKAAYNIILKKARSR